MIMIVCMLNSTTTDFNEIHSWRRSWWASFEESQVKFFLHSVCDVFRIRISSKIPSKRSNSWAWFILFTLVIDTIKQLQPITLCVQINNSLITTWDPFSFVTPPLRSGGSGGGLHRELFRPCNGSWSVHFMIILNTIYWVLILATGKKCQPAQTPRY